MFKKYRGFIIGLLVGGLLMTAFPTMAATVKSAYSLVKAEYPIVVNGTLYENEDLPVLNYDGSTYIPLRAVGEILGTSVNWDDEAREVAIGTNEASATCNSAYCNVVVTGSNGQYTITGVGRLFEATMNYAVEDGHQYLLESFQTLDAGAPAWSAFTLDIEIPAEQLPVNGTLMLELFEYSAKDGSKVNALGIPLESFN